MDGKSRDNRGWYIYVSLFIITVFFLVYKAFHSFGHLDEQFYISTMYRFVQGDAPFLEEWAPSQGYAIIFSPIVRLFIFLNGGTDGIIIAFRFLYIIMHVIVSFLLYRELKKISSFSAMFVSLIYLIYVPYYIMALSYNTIGVESLTLSMVLLLDDEDINLKKVIKFIIAGMGIGIHILCNPFMIILFLLGMVHVIYRWIIKRDIHTLKKWIYVLLGSGIIFVIFCIFVFSKISIKEFLTCIPLILKDPQHQVEPFSLYTLLNVVITSYGAGKKLYMLLFIVTFVYMLDVDRDKRRGLYMIIICCIAGCLLLVSVFSTQRYINKVMFPICILGLYGRILYGERENIRRIFSSLWLPGMIYSACLYYSSTNGYASICHGSIVCVVASGIVLYEVFIIENNGSKFTENIVSTLKRIVETKGEKRIREKTIFVLAEFRSIILCAIIIGILCSQSVVLLYMRSIYYYWEEPEVKQDCYISEGPEKGLFVNKDRADYYNSTLNSITKYNTDEKKVLAVFSSEEWIYLYLKNYRIGTFCPYIGSGPSRLKEYYELNPRKKPDLIYIDSQYKSQYPMDDIILNEYTLIEQIENGAYIYGKE